MHMRRTLLHAGLLTAVIALTLGTTGLSPVAAQGSATYHAQLDATPPAGEPWAFLRIFPGPQLTVHQGDVVESTSVSVDTPHTATFVPTADPNGWRADNQGPGGAYAPIEPDFLSGGDDNNLVVNPAVGFPTNPTCGAQNDPCAFDGNAIENSGIINPNPGAPNSTFTLISAPPGTYSLLCLLHPGMQTLLRVVPAGRSIPTPGEVGQRTRSQARTAVQTDGPVADARAQAVGVKNQGGGHVLWTIRAGGFYKNASANEFVNSGLTVHVGDSLKVNGNFEIHTATFPAGAADRVPFIVPKCERPGKDGNPPCRDPSTLELTINNRALNASQSNVLNDPAAFRSSGLFTDPSSSFTFLAKRPGTYTMVCLVHGPEMSTVITVEK
jgi:plastocyanin